MVKQPDIAQFPEKYYNDPLGLDRYVVQEKVLCNWSAPNKIKKKRSAQEKAYLFLLAAVVIAILLLSGEFLLTVVLGAIIFLFTIGLATKPIYLPYAVTTLGIKREDTYFYWQQLTQFWIEERDGVPIVCVRDLVPTPHTTRIVIPKEDEEKIKTEIAKYLLYKKPKQNYFEKIIDAVYAKLSLDFV